MIQVGEEYIVQNKTYIARESNRFDGCKKCDFYNIKLDECDDPAGLKPTCFDLIRGEYIIFKEIKSKLKEDNK